MEFLPKSCYNSPNSSLQFICTYCSLEKTLRIFLWLFTACASFVPRAHMYHNLQLYSQPRNIEDVKKGIREALLQFHLILQSEQPSRQPILDMMSLFLHFLSMTLMTFTEFCSDPTSLHLTWSDISVLI